MKFNFTLVFIFIFYFFTAAQNDARVNAIYTLGKIPAPLGNYNHVVKARISNNGSSALTDLPVTLTVSGANSFTNTQMISLAAGENIIISFSPFSSWIQGTNTITVTVPNDDNNTNNSQSYTQLVNSNTFSYADASLPISSFGFNTGSGLLLNKYTVTGSSKVTAVRVRISELLSNIGNSVYAVVLNYNGQPPVQSDPHVIQAADLGTYVEFPFSNPPSQTNTDFFVGLAQTANTTNGYFPVSYQDEGNPTRPEAYYYSDLSGGMFGPTESTTLGRLMIEAVVTIGDELPFVNANNQDANNTIAAWNFTGANAPVSFAATYFDTGLSSTDLITRGDGAPACPGSNSFQTANFKNDGISTDNSDYFQVALSPDPGDTLSITKIYCYLEGEDNFSASPGVSSQFAYSLNGVNFTLIGTPVITEGSPSGRIEFDLSGIPALQQVVTGTTITLRYYASGQNTTGEWGFKAPSFNMDPGALFIKGRVRSHSLTTNPVVPTGAAYNLADCNSTATGSIGFTSTGPFGASNVYTAQLGVIDEFHQGFYNFNNVVNVGTLASNANGGTINFTIPPGTNGNTQYAIRIVSSDPPLTGSFSQGFGINAGYCTSVPQNYFRSKVASGNWSDPGTWETAQNFNGPWIPATIAPDNNAFGVDIIYGDTVNITSSVASHRLNVYGVLRLLNGNGNNGVISIFSERFSLYNMKIDTGGVFQVVSSAAPYSDAIKYEGGSIRVLGKIMIGDGFAAIAQGYDSFATSGSPTSVGWYAGSVFEWNSINGFGPVSNATYFPDFSFAILRLTKIPNPIIGGSENTTINGTLEVNTPLTWTGSGEKIFTDGIKGSSTVSQAMGSGVFRITTYPFEQPDNTPPLAVGILGGNVSINLTTGLTIEQGAFVPGGAHVSVAGPVLSQGTFDVHENAEITLQPASTFNLDNADLFNEGNINGPGGIIFTGGNSNALSAPGTLTAPLSLSSKQLYLASGSNINSVQLTGGSNLQLGQYNLNMGSGTLTGDNTNFIITNDTGRINRYVNGSSLFHIGISNTSYTPVTVTNNGSPDNYNVRVAAGVNANAPFTTGNVDRTWFVGDSAQAGCHIDLTVQWSAAEEQPGFNRNSCYISHYSNGSFYDAAAPAPATGSGLFSIQRTGIDSLNSPAFIVSSDIRIYTFTGDGDWATASNWISNVVPPSIIPAGIQVIIAPSGQCNRTGDITIQPGAKLTVKANKIFKITGNVVVE